MLGYDFHIEYVPTQEFGQADALSRLIDKFRRDNAEELQVAGIREVESELLQIRSLTIDRFGKELRRNLETATMEDPVLSTVIRAIRDNKWDRTADQEVLKPFRQRLEDLSIVDHTLMLGDRVVIPKILQPAILAALHKGHPGIRRSKQLAREFVFWPKMLDDIEHLVRQCDACALEQKMPRKVPLEGWPAATKPMERVHIDYAGPINGQYLLIFIDAFSKFLDVAITPTISANRTVELCREVFARYGPPDILVSDHGTQFTSQAFETFCKGLQCTHLMSAVNHPQSNGQVERMVDTVKRAIAKDPSNWRAQLFDFLHSYRYTPCSTAPSGKSPAEVFFGRRINSPFSKLFSGQQPEDAIPVHPNQTDMEAQFRKHHGAQPRSLSVGDRVVVLLRKDKREQGTVAAVVSKVRYSVRRDGGNVVERHLNHIWRGGSTILDPGIPSPASERVVGDDDGTLLAQCPTQPVDGPATSVTTQPVDNPAVDNPATPDSDLPRQPVEARSPDTGVLEELATPRPVRNRIAPRRLQLDPNARSYSYW